MPPARQAGWGRVWNRWVFSGWVRQVRLGCVGSCVEMCGLMRQSRWRRKRWGWVGFDTAVAVLKGAV